VATSRGCLRIRRVLVVGAAAFSLTLDGSICILEAMLMGNHITVSRDRTVTEAPVSDGDVVETGRPLAFIE